MSQHPNPEAALDGAVKELKALGHDLWHWDDYVWGHDYMTPRPNAGLHICPRDDEAQQESGAPFVIVTFSRRSVV
jgi:hypothetical protein